MLWMFWPLVGFFLGAFLIVIAITLFYEMGFNNIDLEVCFPAIIFIFIGAFSIYISLFNASGYRDQMGDRVIPLNIYKHNNSIFISFEDENGKLQHLESDTAAIYNSTNIYVQETKRFSILNMPCGSVYELRRGE